MGECEMRRRRRTIMVKYMKMETLPILYILPNPIYHILYIYVYWYMFQCDQDFNWVCV